MKRSSFLVMLWVLLLPALGLGGEAKAQSLMIDGSAEARALWLVEVNRQGGEAGAVSQVYQRAEGDPRWSLATTVPAAAVDSAVFEGGLALLLHDGSWILVGRSSGQPLPDSERIVELSGGEKDLYALGAGGEGPTTASVATASSGGKGELRLYRMESAGWKRLGELPAEAKAGWTALGVNGRGAPEIAYVHERTLYLCEWRSEGWRTEGTWPARAYVPRKLMSEGGQSIIFLEGAGDGPILLVRGTNWRSPVALAKVEGAAAIGLAGGQLRYVHFQEGRVREQRLDPRTLEVKGEGALDLPDTFDLESLRQKMNWGMMVAALLVGVWVVGTRKRYQKVNVDWSQVNVAPIGRRLLAGVIDYLPVMVAMGFAQVQVRNIESVSDLLGSWPAMRLYLIGMAAYIAITAFSEVVFGRTLGKKIAGLYVINFNGERPGSVAMLMRNLLRVIDLTVIFVAVVLILYLPLRQRIGDMAAGTLVVVRRRKEESRPG